MFPQLLRVTCSICGATQPNPRASYQHRVMQLGECWGASKLGTWTLAAHSRNFRGSFAKFHWRFPGEAVCKHLHSPSEQLQVVASLSGLRLLRLLVYDSGDWNRRILYALPGLGTEILRLQFVSLWHMGTLPPTSSAGRLPSISILCQSLRKENVWKRWPSINLSRKKKIL